MAREYPRFIYVNPKNTKSEGPFIVHCIYPRCIMKVIVDPNMWGLEFIEFWENSLEEDETGLKESEQRKILQHANDWLKSQLIQKQISF